MRLLLLLVLCACTVSTFAGDAGAPPTSGPDYAVLRLDEVLRTSKTYLARVDQLKKDKSEVDAHLKQMEEQLQKINGALEVLSPSSDKFAQAQEEREVLKVKTELLAKRSRMVIDRRHGALLKETYEIIRGHLATFAKERKIRLVALAPNPEIPNGGSNDILMQLGMQTALYYDPSIDITEAFIAYANGRYAAEAPAPAAPAGP
jgi:Skp family chaperone for outer membrane proteins